MLLEVLKSQKVQWEYNPSTYTFTRMLPGRMSTGGMCETDVLEMTAENREHEVIILQKIKSINEQNFRYSEEVYDLEKEGYSLMKSSFTPGGNEIYRKTRRVAIEDVELHDYFIGLKNFYDNFNTAQFDKQVVLDAMASRSKAGVLAMDLHNEQLALSKMITELAKQKSRIEDFNNLPWYKRICQRVK